MHTPARGMPPALGVGRLGAGFASRNPAPTSACVSYHRHNATTCADDCKSERLVSKGAETASLGRFSALLRRGDNVRDNDSPSNRTRRAGLDLAPKGLKPHGYAVFEALRTRAKALARKRDWWNRVGKPRRTERLEQKRHELLESLGETPPARPTPRPRETARKAKSRS